MRRAQLLSAFRAAADSNGSGDTTPGSDGGDGINDAQADGDASALRAGKCVASSNSGVDATGIVVPVDGLQQLQLRSSPPPLGPIPEPQRCQSPSLKSTYRGLD
jgi:hypothetical protein